MLRQLYGELHLVKAIILTSCLVSVAAGVLLAATENDEVPRQLLPEPYRSASDAAVCNCGGDRIWFVCAEPSVPPTSTRTPPYVRLFLIASRNSEPRVLWSQDAGTDNVCLGVEVTPQDDGSCICSAMSRPFSGSVAVNHLRVYRCASEMHEPPTPRQVLAVEYIDGIAALLKGRSNCGPAFLICEPLYEAWPKSEPQLYRFRVYVPSRLAYRLEVSVQTKERYEDCASAYLASKARIERLLGEVLNLPGHLESQE